MTSSHLRQILDDPRPEPLEELAQEAARVTRQYFGGAVTLYAPIYLANFCSSRCVYCGFSSQAKIHRRKLEPAQYRGEMAYLHDLGIRNVLLLTGESLRVTPVAYLEESARAAAEHFQGIAIEVYPMETDDYRRLFAAGVDGLTIYQETYDRARYAEVHLSGFKKDYDYRRATPARAAEAGFRQISLGILLGLQADAAADVSALWEHLRELERAYPGVEYSVSFPRLRPIKTQEFVHGDVTDVQFIKILCLTRIFFPRVGINLSTRESAQLRDHAVGLAVTRISAGSNTAVGGYSVLGDEAQDPQFDIKDERSVAQIVQMLKTRGFDPVFTDWRNR